MTEDLGRSDAVLTGRLAGAAIRSNLAAFWHTIGVTQARRNRLVEQALSEASLLSVSVRKQIAESAQGADVSPGDLIAYNLYRDTVSADGCSVMLALPDATTPGKSLLLKNSDQVGSERMVGPNFEHHKEIYVVQVVRAENGVNIVGLSAAGSTGFKVGVNDRGVAAGANIARTIELARRRVDLASVRASDRTQLLREGLEESSALAAVQRVAVKVTAWPTSTPGNIEFIDPNEAWILETSYEHVALIRIRHGTACRANRFEVLDRLNDSGDVSSASRYSRMQELFRIASERLTAEQFMAFSMDHANGPGQSSICRHGSSFTEETTLGAAVIEIDAERPELSTIALAVGKPCHAWRSTDGWIRLPANCDLASVPRSFMDGTAWRRFYSESPNLSAVG